VAPQKALRRVGAVRRADILQELAPQPVVPQVATVPRVATVPGVAVR
jgi:hypothetical protein